MDRSRIQIRNFNFYYRGFKALEDININISAEAVTALIGPSGCGKSTFLRSLNRMNDLIPGARIEGEILLDNLNIYNAEINLIELRKRVGMVFQKPNPFPSSIYENVAYGPRIHGIKKKLDLDAIVEKSLKRAALWDEVRNKLKKSAFELSGGQQQRLCIARSLAVEPEVILMDEPCSALDPASTQRIEDLISELKKKYTIIIATHNMQQAARVSDYTAFLLAEDADKAAKLIEFDRTDFIFTHPSDKRTENYITGRFG